MIERFVLTVFIGASVSLGGLDPVSYTGFSSRDKCEAAAVELMPALLERAGEAFSGTLSNPARRGAVSLGIAVRKGA